LHIISQELRLNLSNMDPQTHWMNLLGDLLGHVRVGWEDNPYIDGSLLIPTPGLVEKLSGSPGFGPGNRHPG
jgi:hypothetical protein